MYRSPKKMYLSVNDPQGRRQAIAKLEASLSGLRTELNCWWSRTGGMEPCEGPQLLAIRLKIRESAALERGIER